MSTNYHGDDWGPDFLDEPEVSLLDGPHRIYDDSPTIEPHQPLGFAAATEAARITTETGPQLWDGDQA